MRLPPLRFRAFERRGTIRLRDAPPRYPWPWGAAGHPAVGTFVIRPARRIAADDLRTRARASPDGLPSGRRPRAARAGGVCGRRMGRGLLCKPASPKWLLAQAISPPPFSRTKPRSGEDPGPFRQWHAHTIDPHRVKVPDSRAADDAHTGDVCRGFRENERRGGEIRAAVSMIPRVCPGRRCAAREKAIRNPGAACRTVRLRPLGPGSPTAAGMIV